jgi:hypothetical protein
MSDIKIKKLPQECFDIYEQYNNVPYYINKSKNKFLKNINRGKASPKEIDLFILNKNNNKALKGKNKYNFLKENKVGIDCSGFVSYILEELALKNKDKHIWEIIHNTTKNPIKIFYSHKIRPISSKMNADILTNDINSITIKKINDIKPGDLIRMNGGKHIAIISEVHYNKKNVSKIIYWQSTENIGACESEIIIKDPNKELKDQLWNKIKGSKYDTLSLYKKKINSNGVKRLKLIS